MGIDIGKSLALTAASGLVAGLAACGGHQEPAKDPSTAAGEAPAAEPAAHAEAPAGDKECCKGKNDCKAKGNCTVPVTTNARAKAAARLLIAKPAEPFGA